MLERILKRQNPDPVIIIECLTVPNPPDKVLDALEPIIDDPDVNAWVDALGRAIEKSDLCAEKI